MYKKLVSMLIRLDLTEEEIGEIAAKIQNEGYINGYKEGYIIGYQEGFETMSNFQQKLDIVEDSEND